MTKITATSLINVPPTNISSYKNSWDSKKSRVATLYSAPHSIAFSFIFIVNVNGFG